MSAVIATNLNSIQHNDLNRLAKWLQQHAPNDILMPLNIARHSMETHDGHV